MLTPYYRSPDKAFALLEGDCAAVLPQFDFLFDMVFADPPYFLSSGGISCQGGKVVCVDKGEWDKAAAADDVDCFNERWLAACRDKLKENGTIWVSGTHHNLFSVGRAMERLGFRILNVVTWVKTNPPPNISCRVLTHSAEFVIWARKCRRAPHTFNYSLMRRVAGDRQMTDVWQLPSAARWEKTQGRHPTQKPLALLCRATLAATKPGAWVLDPFAGSSTTGVAAALLGRRLLGIEREREFLDLSRRRREELDEPGAAERMRSRLKDLESGDGDTLAEDGGRDYGLGLPF